MRHPKYNNTSFKKGQVPWNKQEKIKRNCGQCDKEFYLTNKQNQMKDRWKCCSKQCSDIYRKENSNSKENICLRLIKEGKTQKEISQLTGFPPGSVASYLNKALYRNGPGKSYAAQKRRLLKIAEYKSCAICGFDRIVELAHIIPASKGGDMEQNNIIGLCPNHHHLFDNNRLTEDELKKVNNIIKEKQNA